MDINECCLVMTGCINPSEEVYALVLNDAEKRRRQYELALLFYIKKTKIKNIVFCDNSNEQMDNTFLKLAKDNKKNIELLGFQGNMEKTLEKGKGYGEGEILEYIFNHSKLIKECKYIVKVTGRLVICNLDNILRLSYKVDNYINMFIYSNGNYFVDTRFFVMKITDYKNFFLKEYEKVDDKNGQSLEVCFAKRIYEERVPYRLFPIYINYKGTSGSTGKVYNISLKNRIKNNMVLYLKYLMNYDKKVYPVKMMYEGIELDDAVWEERFIKYTEKKVAIYGAGMIGQLLYKLCVKHCKVILWVDKDYFLKGKILGKKVESPQKLKKKKMDCIIVAVKSEALSMEIASEIRKMLVEIPIYIFHG